MAIKPGDQNRGISEKKSGSGEESTGAGKGSPATKRSAAPTRNPMKSPLMQGAYDTSRARTRKMTLPVTKKVVELTIKTIDPDDVWVSQKINPRNQDLLSEKDPHIASLRQSIKNETQREPVLVRQNPGPNGERYEVIYGSRRRYVAALEKRAHGSFDLLAEVGEISDPDALRLARVENSERQDLSAYELGCDYARQKENQYKDFEQKEMAAAIGVSEANLSKHLALSRIPEAVIKLFVSPAVITVKEGPKILRLVENHGAENLAERLRELSETNASFDKVSQFLKAIESRASAESGAVKVSRDKPVVYGRGVVKAKLSAIRGKKNTYKIDLAGVGKDELKKLDEFLEALCS